MAKLTFYVQAVPRFGYNDYLYDDLTLGKVTSKKPKKPVANAKVVKVVLKIPNSIFIEAVPTVTLDVPIEHITSISGSTEEPEDDYSTVA